MRILTEIQLNLDSINSQSLIITVVGYVIVFVSLLLLAMVFQNLPRLLNLRFPKKKKNNGTPTSVTPLLQGLTGEEVAAISAALYLFLNDLHDEESRVVTINRISKKYSPWSSKIYSVVRGLNKRF